MTALLDSIGYTGWVLHALIWLPVLGIGLVLWAGEAQAKTVAFWCSILVFVLSLGLWWAFDSTEASMQMQSTAPWIETWGVSYSLGIDGISLFMVMLTTFSTSLAILGSLIAISNEMRDLILDQAVHHEQADLSHRSLEASSSCGKNLGDRKCELKVPIGGGADG